MKNMFLFGIVASALVLGCSDPVKPDADSSSSSGTSITSSSSTKSSSSTALTSSSSGGLNNSSSGGTSATSSSSTKSSSSTALSSSSSGGLNNSSSGGTSATSSSSTKSSSSTALSSSSSDGLNSSSSTAKSSSSISLSSSSQPKSSSSYKTQDDIPFGGINTVYDSIYDPRDSHKYLYSTYTANNGYGTILTISVMVQNLDYAEVITLGAEEQDDDTKVEKYCYNDIPQNCDFYGGLYQWAEMMALPYECNTISCAHLIQDQHQGICPDGWHLITNPEMWVIINSTDEGIEGVKARSTWAIGGGRNTSGFTLLGAGSRYRDGTYKNLNRTAHWYFPTEHESIVARSGSGYISGYENNFRIDNGYNPKVDAYSVRCVKNY